MGRLLHFRAAFLLILSSALLFWVVSFWLPLGQYLSAITDKEYEPYRALIQIMVASYLSFVVLNLVVAGLFFTKLNSKVKFWMALVPAVYVFLLPFIITIPVAIKFPKENYFVVYQAVYRVFRFTRPDTLTLAILASLVVLGLNVLAAILAKRGSSEGTVSPKVRSNYFAFGAGFAVVLSIFLGITLVNANMRSLDRFSCEGYLKLEVPILDDEIEPFLNDVNLYGQQAGTSELRTAMQAFAQISRQYNALLVNGGDEGTIAQFEVGVSSAKQRLTEICTEFSTK